MVNADHLKVETGKKLKEERASWAKYVFQILIPYFQKRCVRGEEIKVII